MLVRRHPGCSPGEAHQNIAAFGPWDQLNGVPTLTTIGNNANTHEAWANPLTPGGTEQAPDSPTRDYTDRRSPTPGTTARCDPTNLVPGGNDINAVVTNLFRRPQPDPRLLLLPRLHRAELQPPARQRRPRRPGRRRRGRQRPGRRHRRRHPSFEGRDNANQIALQDGVPGITNQYLFQPIAGAFYSPCADGALDTGIYGHEYTHAISNRMVGGPDDGLTSEQGGAMGESWGDLNAAEYQFENDYSTGTNPWSLGSYTTGNSTEGIRDYAINDNPLNYCDYGFDTTGAEVHADGEIWNGTQWEVRQALVDKWDSAGSSTPTRRCRSSAPRRPATETPAPAPACPGNRRWLQLIYDAWLLQPGATDMLRGPRRDARGRPDALRRRQPGALWAAFARRGMGARRRRTPDPDSTDATPSFTSPTATTPRDLHRRPARARSTSVTSRRG